MSDFKSLCDALSGALVYPEDDFVERVTRYRDLVAVEAPAAAEQTEAFMANIDGKSLSELEEYYIRTFDLNPDFSLDTGWQLFGEEYNRGLYMVRVRNEMRRHGVPETSELPDHLTNVLFVLGRMSEEDAINFAVCCVIPAVEKILGAIKSDNAYHPLIQGIVNLLESRYGQYVEEAAQAAEAAEAEEEKLMDHSGVFALKEANHE